MVMTAMPMDIYAEQLDIGKYVRQHHDDDRTQDRSGTRFASAHDDRQQEQYGQFEVVGIGRDVFLGIREQAARQSRDARTQHKGVHLVGVHAHAHTVRCDRAVMQSFESATQV